MTYLGQFLSALVDVMAMAVTFVVNLISGLIHMIQIIPSALSMLSYGVSSLPPVLTVFATAFISVSVVYLVIGR